MSESRNERDMEAEIADLWRETFGEQPAIRADAAMMLDVLVSCLADVGPWEFRSPPRPAQTGTLGDLERLEDLEAIAR